MEVSRHLLFSIPTLPLQFLKKHNTMSSNPETHGISIRMANKLPRLPPPSFLAYQPPPDTIRLEQAENCLIRPQLLKICKDTMNQDLTEEVIL